MKLGHEISATFRCGISMVSCCDEGDEKEDTHMGIDFDAMDDAKRKELYRIL